MKLYLAGSLRNSLIPELTKTLTEATGHEIFSEWYGAGPTADDCFKEYHRGLGRDYRQALASDAAKTIYHFDRDHILSSDGLVLVCPAGRSGFCELGFAAGAGKRTFILLDDTIIKDRWDLMVQFADTVCFNTEELIKALV
jgi:nucleoside 2-deoxyribosyltransferase